MPELFHLYSIYNLNICRTVFFVYFFDGLECVGHSFALKYESASYFSPANYAINLDSCGEYSLRTWSTFGHWKKKKLRRFFNTINYWAITVRDDALAWKGSHSMGGGRIFQKTRRDVSFNKVLWKEPTFGLIHLAGQYLQVQICLRLRFRFALKKQYPPRQCLCDSDSSALGSNLQIACLAFRFFWFGVQLVQIAYTDSLSGTPILLIQGATYTDSFCLALRFFWFGVQLIQIACLAFRFFWFRVQLIKIVCLALRFFWFGV